MRRWSVIGAVVAILGSAPVAALAVNASGTGGGDSPVNCQTTRWTSAALSARSSYATIDTLTTDVAAVYPVTVTLSGVVRGQPVDFRVVDHFALTQIAEPGVAPMTPVGGHATSFSFTWVAPGNSAAVRGHTFTIEWRRSTTTGSSTLVKADVALTYTADLCRATDSRAADGAASSG
jgi:hypothetical protein